MLTLSDVAAHLNCTVNIVRKLIRAGQLRAVRFSPRVVRVPEQSVVAFLDQ